MGRCEYEVVAGTENPTYIDYSYGNGNVEATMQTVEWGYGDPPAGINYCWVGPREEFLRNELKCCQMYIAAPVPTLTPIGLIALVGLLSIVAAMSIRTGIRKKRR